MIKNVIFGKRSKLTKSLISKIDNYEIISSSEITNDRLKLLNNNKKNYIINNFYPTHKLDALNPSDYEKFIELSLTKLIKILSNLNFKNINKIIYTSSSSVYGIDNNLNISEKDKFNRKIYASFKYSAEKIIENFCYNKKINFYIMRLFNTYGDKNDDFSFIEKLIKIKKNNLNLKLANNGISLRDFIHLDDVASIYKKFLKNNYKSGIYDIGSGRGRLIKNLVDFVGIDKKKIIRINNINEIQNSIADLTKLKKNLGDYKFKNLEKYIKSQIKISNQKKFFYTKNDYPVTKYEGSVIYGAGFAGINLLSKLKYQKEKIIYFIDDDQKKQNTLVNNIPVISLQDLVRINRKKTIDKIFIAIPSLNEKKIKLINKKLRQSFFDIRSLPQKKYLISNKIDLNDLKIEQINSILNRNTIHVKKINTLKNKNILVTGAAGTIGFEICRQLVYQEANKIIGIDQSEISVYKKKNIIDKKIKLLLCDVNDIVLLNQIISKNKISLIIHAAAYKHVNILEDNIYAAIRNNIMGTKNICDAAIKNHSDLILISTDKAAEPRSILGYSKKICEQLIHFYNSKKKKEYFNIVRFGNVFGSSGSAVSKFMEQINNNQPVTITNKSASRFFMTILEACYLVLESTSLKLKNKTFILNMGKPINIYKLAFKLAQLKKNLDPTYKMKFIEIGLKRNEKLHEKLFQKNEKLQKINKNLFFVSNNNFDYQKFNQYFLNLEKEYSFLAKKDIINYLKRICKI